MDNLTDTKFDKGVAKCPFNPHANITTLMTENGELFVGSPTDFSGTDPAILRADVTKVYEVANWEHVVLTRSSVVVVDVVDENENH